ncbi:MAG: nucleoside monophosphate kinase [Nitrospirae bacterium]|nr:nucleoside monophosphate kinase [Nitrospirota bacterium]
MGLLNASMKSVRKPADAVLLIGPTGSGKTPLGSHIEQHGMSGRKCHHFDFGHELRSIADAEILPQGFTEIEQQFLRDMLIKGLLLEDRHFPLAEKIVRDFLAKRIFEGSDMLILNGLPRHTGQARDMAELVNVTCLLVLECTAEDVCERIKANTGGDRTDRIDDADEMIRKKLKTFHNRTTPLIDHYAEQGSTLIKIPVHASATAEAVYSRLVSLLVL